TALGKARAERRPDMRLALNMTVMRTNAHEMPAIVQLAYDLGYDGVQLYKLNDGVAYNWTERTRNGFVFVYQEELPEHHRDYVRPFLDRADRLACELRIKLEVDQRLRAMLVTGADMVLDAPPVIPPYSACTAPWSWLNISASGEVYPCCNATAPLGSL